MLAGKYSSLTGLATMDFSSETANSAHSSSSSQVRLRMSLSLRLRKTVRV